MAEMIIFSNNSQKFAIKAEYVEEILQPVSVTTTPHTNDIVNGLINVHGKVVLLFDFGRIVEKSALQMQQTLSTEQKKKGKRAGAKNSKPLSNILLLNHNNQLFGLAIEEVIEKTIIPDDIISNFQNSEKAPVYEGQFLHNDQMIITVSLATVMDQVVSGKVLSSKRNQIAFGHTTLLEDANHENKVRADDISFLIGKINDSVFGLELSDIQELIILSDITPVPFLPKEVIGLTNLRNMPLIVISLSQVIFNSAAAKEYQYGIITKTQQGLIIFALHDLIRIDRFEKDTPHYIKRQDKQIKGWLKQPDNFYAPIIDLKSILNSPLLQELNGYINETENSNMSYTSSTSKRYLITKMHNEYYGICLDHIKIVVDEISIKELPVAQYDAASKMYIKGISQIHGEIIYVLDTHKLLDKEVSEYKNYVIMYAENRNFALPIENVDMVVNVSESAIESLATTGSIVNQIAKVNKQLISIIDPSFMVQYLPHIGVLK